MAKTHERAFAFFFAVIFLIATVAFSIAVIWEIRSNKDQDAVVTDTSIQEQSQNTNQTQENTLQGTKLQNFTPIESVTKLETIDIKEGTGDVVQPGATVKAHYTGALATDGTIFQSSYDSGSAVEFGLDQVIKGWTDGVPGMRVGGTRRIIIPAEQAYGATERPGIPANSALVFDITLEGVTQ